MPSSKTVDVILPVYHEQENLKTLLKGFKNKVKSSLNIIFVLQDRNDPSVKIVKNFRTANIKSKIIFTLDGKGLGKAIKAGLKNARSEFVIIMMSDLSDNPADLDLIVKKLIFGYDLVCASRNTASGSRRNAPLFKSMLSIIASQSLFYLAGIPTRDATNAFKGYRRNLLNNLSIESQEGYEMPLELTVKAFKAGAKITDIPTIWQERSGGKSQFKFFKLLPNYIRWYLFAVL